MKAPMQIIHKSHMTHSLKPWTNPKSWRVASALRECYNSDGPHKQGSHRGLEDPEWRKISASHHPTGWYQPNLSSPSFVTLAQQVSMLLCGKKSQPEALAGDWAKDGAGYTYSNNPLKYRCRPTSEIQRLLESCGYPVYILWTTMLQCTDSKFSLPLRTKSKRLLKKLSLREREDSEEDLSLETLLDR